MLKRIVITLVVALMATSAQAFDLGVVAFQMSSQTHARVANAAKAAAEDKGWNVVVLNSGGSLSKHAQQIETLIQKDVDGIVLAMSKPVQFEAQLAGAKKAGIPVITVMSGGSDLTLFDVAVNEYAVGARAALYLLGQLGYHGNILVERYEGNVGTRIRGKELDVVLSENTGVKVIGSHTMGKTKGWRSDVRNGMQALIMQHTGQFQGIWASFDAQAFIIDDLLQARGKSKGDIVLVSIDGGQEAFRRIADPNSLLTATVSIPFEKMGRKAVEAMQAIAVDGKDPSTFTSGPYLFLQADLVDQSNVDDFLQK